MFSNILLPSLCQTILQEIIMSRCKLTERSVDTPCAASTSSSGFDVVAYDADGSVRSVADNGVADSFVSDELHPRYHWSGRDHDVDPDLQHNRARCFDPQPGRWIEAE
ncbi:MAG: hypothetical protein U0939_27150 [Pirellulales bacterium]